MDYIELLGIFVNKLDAGRKVSDEGLEAFTKCDNLDELIDEVAVRMIAAEGDRNKAAIFILRTLASE